MVFVIVETLADYPLTPETPSEVDIRVLDCLTEREASWQYSLLSVDRHRMICIFDAPDAESVRESYRRGGATFQTIWAGELFIPDGHQPLRQLSSLQVVEGTYPSLTPEEWDDIKRKTLPCYAEQGIEWVQAYLSSDRTRMVCELNAPDAEAVRAAQAQLGISFDRVWSALLIKA